MRKRNAEKEAYWRKMLHRHQETGQSVREFCRRHGLSEPSFYSWRKKIRKCDRSSAVRDGNSKITRPAAASGPFDNNSAFIPLQLMAVTDRTIELVHPRGHVLRIPTTFDETALEKVLQLLDRDGEG